MLTQEEVTKVNSLYQEIDRLNSEATTFNDIDQKLTTIDTKLDQLLELINTQTTSAKKTTRSSRSTKKT